MSEEKYNATKIQAFLGQARISTIGQLKRVLGSNVRMTVLRKLSTLDYQTSYSHNGKFYTLKSLCEFDRNGLWSCRNIWFSVYGTLLETGKNFINRSDAGYSVSELDDALHVSTKQALLHLHKKNLVGREKSGGVFIYYSTDENILKRQLSVRNEISSQPLENLGDDLLAHELKAAIILFFSVLDERQRRYYAGLESMKIGRGGDAKVSEILGIDPHTVSKGRAELLNQDVDIDKVRRSGSGRNKVEKKRQK